MAFIGMDPQAVVQIAEKLAAQERQVTTIAQTIDATMNSARGVWRGADVDRFLSAWNGQHRAQLTAAAAALAELAIKAYANAQEQVEVSNQYGGATMAGGGVNIGGILSQLNGLQISASTSTSGSLGISGGTSGHTTIIGIPMSGRAHYFAGVQGQAGAHFSFNNGTLDTGASASGIAGGMASASGSIGNHYFSASGSGQALAGAQGQAQAGVVIGPDGAKIDLGASGVAGAQAKANAQLGNSFANISGSGEAMAGAEGSVESSTEIGPDGVAASGGVDGFAGAKLEGHVNESAGGFTFGAGGGLEAGVGGTAEAGASFTKDDVGFTLNLGGALGGGLDLDINASVNPEQVYSELSTAWNDAPNVASSAIHDVSNLLGL